MNLHQKEIEIKQVLQKVDLGMAKIAPLVTKHLIEEFEKTGVSPVFSKDGNIAGLRLTNRDDWQNIVGQVADFGYSLEQLFNNFWLARYDEISYGANITDNLQGRILIISKQSGKSKEYQIANTTQWLADFIQDLKNNFFQS